LPPQRAGARDRRPARPRRRDRDLPRRCLRGDPVEAALPVRARVRRGVRQPGLRPARGVVRLPRAARGGRGRAGPRPRGRVRLANAVRRRRAGGLPREPQADGAPGAARVPPLTRCGEARPGKTAAFLIAGFTRILRSGGPAAAPPAAPRVLVIAPTRELVVQIESDARLLGKFTGLRILSVYGGIDYAKQRDELREGCDVLVGTPGRLIDYLKQHVWSPRRVEVLVIVEADRMFDMGFIADLRFLLRRLPPVERRQSFLFSATL